MTLKGTSIPSFMGNNIQVQCFLPKGIHWKQHVGSVEVMIIIQFLTKDEMANYIYWQVLNIEQNSW